MSNFNYFHGGEGEQFSFFRIPRDLMKDERYRSLSAEAKLLYGLMLDRMGLSRQNGWLDEDDRVFIFYTVHEVEETLSCGHNKAVRLLAELEQYALIERVRQGQGKPARIYVRNFAPGEAEEQTDSEESDLKRSEKSTCSGPLPKLQDFPKGERIYTDKNYTDFIQINQSINQKQLPPTSEQEIDGCGCQEGAHSGEHGGSAAFCGAVRASMSFVKHKRPLVRGRRPPKTPSQQNASHRETHFPHPIEVTT